MPTDLFIVFGSSEDLRAYLDHNYTQGTLLLPGPDGDQSVGQFDALALQFVLPDGPQTTPGEVLQLLPGGGLVVRMVEPDTLNALAGDARAAAQAMPPLVSWSAFTSEPDDEPEEEPEVEPVAQPRGYGPLSWPIERLHKEWNTLPLGDMFNLARRGDLGVRRLILKKPDPRLHQHLVDNPGMTPGEIAAMAGMANLPPDVLKRIASRPEWLRHTSVVRNLLTNPKMPLDIVSRLVQKLPDRELRQLTRGGRVREPVKRIILKKVSR